MIGEIVTPTHIPPTLDHLFTLRAELGARRAGEPGPHGQRVHNVADGGAFDGSRLKGRVAPGSSDWMLVRPDGSMVIDARVVLETDAGQTIHMTYGGRAVIPAEVLAQARDPASRGDLDPSRYYFRTQPLFETAADGLGWLNNVVCVGVGRLTPSGLDYEVFAVT
jgi:hypothetical protein